MPGIASLRRRPVELAWGLFALACFGVMLAWPEQETVPFHLVWFTLTLLYGFRVWGRRATAAVLAVVCVLTGASISHDAIQGTQLWAELTEVPLMSAMFLAMVWHARRRQSAMAETAEKAQELSELLSQQERFLQEVSHELRTPVTIARGHIEVLQRSSASAEAEVALDELERVQRIVERLLLLARAEGSGLSPIEEIELEPFLEDVFMRWSEVAPRIWRLGDLAPGRLHTDSDALRIALDALLENAVDHTGPEDGIEVSARTEAGEIAIAVADEGSGVPPAALDGIFERFSRSAADRSRRRGGVGLGLTIVNAIASAQGGRCTVSTSSEGSIFTLVLPAYAPVPAPDRGEPEGIPLSG
jgi:signal transduction histidine kinase